MQMVQSSSSSSSPAVDHQVPLGGPIYHRDLVGPLTRVPAFETAVVTELQSLKAQLNLDDSSSLSQLLFGDGDGEEEEEFDLSVDDLKIFSEEDLAQKALKEAFPQNQQPAENSSTACLDSQDGEGELVRNSRSTRMGRPPKATSFEKNTKKSNKRGRTFDRENRAVELENVAFIEKVEHLARIKQKQDEDKIAARLHSFNGASNSKVNEGPVSPSMSSDKVAKMKSLRFITSTDKMRIPSNVIEHVPITYPEVVLCIEVYKNNMWTKTQEFLVLGSQRLSELRDQLYCLTDHLMHKEGKFDPSGYFLVEDVFCNDMRDPSAIDYSEPILDWLRNSKDEALAKWESILSGELQQKQRALLGDALTPPLPQFRAVEMHNIRFCDLWFRLGAGYLYCHQGDCKHHIVIRDMRLIHPEDVQNRASYPVLTFQLKTRHHKCSVCKIYRATKFTVDDKWAQENPCHFCDNCYYYFHYAEDNSLLYPDFTVYDYHHE